MAILPSYFMDAVVSIGEPKPDGTFFWYGTGFFVFRYMDDKIVKPFLVTNKHVIANRSHVVFRMKRHNSEELVQYTLKIIPANMILHSNPNIDIAILMINGDLIMQNDLDFCGFDIDGMAMSSSELRENGVDEGSLIYMLGFPMGLVNTGSGLPICRLGCIARMSEAQIKENHNILMDVQNFPGNSGSPVVLRPEVVSVGNTKTVDRAVLIGIIHSYIPYKENLVNSQTGEIVEIRSENSGLANAHPVEYIREMIDNVMPKIV